MNNPQIEDGYTRIANELMEQVPRCKLNGTQLRLILVIWRYTYGFKRKHHEFSISFLADALQTSRSHVDRELKSLIDRNIVQIVSSVPGKPRKLSFNKRYTEWLNERCTTKGGQSEGVPQKVDTVSYKEGTELSHKTGTKKERKKILKKGMSGMGVHKQIIDYLNAKANKRFSHKSAANQKLINGRMAEGRTIEDFFYVIDTKVSHWLDDEKMNEYLRPSTLFAQKNFENYLNQNPKQGHKRDGSIATRNKEIEFQQWIADGGDPDEFDWS